MNDIPIAQVYAVVKDYTDYRGHPSTDQEVKAFVDRFLTPDPKVCIYAHGGICCFMMMSDTTPTNCVGLDACKKAEMLLGVKL